jgi:Bacterial CdiA-CT RNAse A domain
VWGRFNSLRICRFALCCAVALLTACGQPPAPLSPSHEQTQTRANTIAASDRYDLARDEARGGHTLQRHVGRSDAQLRERLLDESNISAASTWTDRETAEVTIAEALHVERARIDRWMRRGYPRANLALHFNTNRVIGRTIRRGDQQPVNCTSAIIVLRADGPDSFYILTAYPEGRE